MTGPSPGDIERRLDELEERSEIPGMTLTHLIDSGQGPKELVDEERGIWYCPATDDLRRGPTKKEVEDSGGFVDSMIRDEEELET